MILIGTMPRAESGDERRDCVTLWAVQLRRASAVAESTLGVTLKRGYDGDIAADIFAGSLPAPYGYGYAWRRHGRSRRAPADAASARACAAGVTRLGLRTVLKAGAGCGCLSFPLSNPAVRPRRISFTDTGSSIRFVGGLAWRRYAFSNLPGRSRSACRPGRGRGPHTPSIFCQSSSLRA